MGCRLGCFEKVNHSRCESHSEEIPWLTTPSSSSITLSRDRSFHIPPWNDSKEKVRKITSLSLYTEMVKISIFYSFLICRNQDVTGFDTSENYNTMFRC